MIQSEHKMHKEWADCKNILCIRADNMGDLLMSGPAIRALKETFHAKITVLTSSMAAGAGKHITEIDEIITYDLPWVKTSSAIESKHFFALIKQLKSKNFDAAVLFSVYSQNPLPAAMLAFLAGIPHRLAYCRENPYELLTEWIPDKEPYTLIKHQVNRDLDLVACVGATTSNDKLAINVTPGIWESLKSRLSRAGIDLLAPWLIVHAGVSEKKREYPFNLWVETARRIVSETGYQVLFTGGISEKPLTDQLQLAAGEKTYSLGGFFELDEFISLIDQAPLLISVNTGTVHLAAAVNTPVIVLYALTNPQHVPWKVKGIVLPFDVLEDMQSNNEIIRYVNQHFFAKPAGMILPTQILTAVRNIFSGKTIDEIDPDCLIKRKDLPYEG